MNFEEALKELIELSKSNNNTIYSNDILKYCDEEASDYDKFEEALIKEEIDVVPSSNTDEEDDDIDITDEPNLADVEEIDISTYDQLPSSIKVDDPVRMYLKDIGKIPLLSLEEETQLAKDVVEGRTAKERIEKIDENEDSSITKEEYEELEEKVSINKLILSISCSSNLFF